MTGSPVLIASRFRGTSYSALGYALCALEATLPSPEIPTHRAGSSYCHIPEVAQGRIHAWWHLGYLDQGDRK